MRAMRAALFLLLVAIPAGAGAECGGTSLGVGVVAAVREDATLLLADGREVRLAGIEPGPAAHSVLTSLAHDRRVTLKGTAGADADRYGRLLAFAGLDSGPEDLQEALIANGAARVSARVGDQLCADRLLREEKQAREARRGLWSDPNFAPLAAEPGPWMQTELGRFVLIEGKVLSVRQSGGTIYVNFGRRWTRDFTLTVPRRLQAGFHAAGRDLQTLAGRRIRVRGWLERRTGPIIEAAAPEQIELLE